MKVSSILYKCISLTISQNIQKHVNLRSPSARRLAGPPRPPGDSSQNPENAKKMLRRLAEHS